jgi:hypothetical protein
MLRRPFLREARQLVKSRDRIQHRIDVVWVPFRGEFVPAVVQHLGGKESEGGSKQRAVIDDRLASRAVPRSQCFGERRFKQPSEFDLYLALNSRQKAEIDKVELVAAVKLPDRLGAVNSEWRPLIAVGREHSWQIGHRRAEKQAGRPLGSDLPSRH